MARLKREQKKNMIDYSVIILKEEVIRVVNLLTSCGYKVTDDELLSFIAKEIKDDNDNKNRLTNTNEVKKKFKSAMDEYLERTQKYL